MIFAFDEFELDAHRLELRRSGAPIKADPLVLRLLSTLVRHAGQLVTKQELVTEVWDDRAVAENVITVAMVRLRKTLGHRRNEREFVINVHGRGYRFVRPVTAREAESARLPAPAPPVHDAPPFVGRERVMQRLRALLQAARAGQGGACVLTGEAGIGKTRAVEMLEREAAAAGVRAAFGHCREAGATPPLWPFAQLVRAVIAALPEAALSALGPGAEQLGHLLPELAQRTHARARGSDGADYGYDGAAKHRIFDAVTRVLAIAAERTPWLLVLDDLHRADPASLELLRYFIDEIAHIPVLLVGTARRSADPQPSGAQADLGYVLGHRNCTRIALEPLTEADVASYVSALVDDPGGALARAVFVKSEGNPFYMTELARQLRDAERTDPEALAVPAAALDLIRQRLSRLDEEARGVLSLAAVIGRSFELPLLQAVAQRDPSALMANLDDALASEVVVAAPDSRTAFAFGHELVRGLLYDALAPAERRGCHLRVAQALEQRREAGDDVLAADLAYHVHAALPDGDPRAVVRHCAQAATDAARVYANADVVRHLHHALEALELVPDPSPRLRMGLLLRQLVYARTYSHAEFARTVAEFMRVAREQRAGLPLARAALMLDPHAGFPPMPESRAALEYALELLPEDDTGTRAAVLARLATTAPLAYDRAQSRAQAARALELGRAAGSLLAVYAARVAQLYLEGGELDDGTAREALVELEQLCAEHPTTLTTPPVLLELHRAAFALQRGEPGPATAALDRCAALCRELDNRELSWHVERIQALRRFDAGRLPESIATLRALHDRAAHEAIWGTELFCAYDRAVIFGELARDPFGAAPPALAPRDHDPPNILAIKLRALAAAGLHDRARAGLLALAPSALARLPRDRDHLGTLGAFARTALALGAIEHVRALQELLAPYAQHHAVQVAAPSEGSVAQLLGLLTA